MAELHDLIRWLEGEPLAYTIAIIGVIAGGITVLMATIAWLMERWFE